MKPGSEPGTRGVVLHGAARYDLLVWLSLRGREREFRETVLRRARLAPGDVTLDVGCGTGTLAIAAKRCVGPTGAVYGIDASKEMIARAGTKARKAGVEVFFTQALAEALPFPDAHFDVMLTTVMLHHLPRTTRQQCVREMRRVLKANGRLLVVDFGPNGGHGGRLLAHCQRHGHLDPRDLVVALGEAGLHPIESGTLGIHGLLFVLATPVGAS